MRKLASYSLQTNAAASGGPEALGGAVVQRIDEWLMSKGDSSDDGTQLLLKNGRFAELGRSQLRTARGEITTPPALRRGWPATV